MFTTLNRIALRQVGALACVGTLAVALGAASQSSPVPPSKPIKPGSPSITPPRVPGAPGEKSGDQLVSMKMSADVARIAPSQKFHLAFILDVEPHWHIYWENAGTSGAPTSIDVKAPSGFVVGRTLFTRPQTITTSEGPTYGYEGRCVLFVEVTPPDKALSQVNFTAQASWLVCKDICKMGSASAMLTLPFGTTSVPGASPVEIDPAVKEFKPRLPKNITDVSGASVEFDGKQMVITLPALGQDSTEFFPNPSDGVTFGEARFERSGDMLRTIVPVTLEPVNAMGKPMRLAGVIGLGRELTDPSYAFDVPLADDGRPQRN